MKKKEWLKFRLQASNGFVALPNRIADSKPFASLTTGASVQTLVWFWQMVEYPRGKRKKGAEPVIGRIDKITNNGELSFTYQEAEWRGMNSRRFSRALKDLYRLGFIDIKRHGRGVRGEYTKFAISTRWQSYGTPDWQEIPFPENFHEGFRADSYRKNGKKIADENVRYSADDNVRYEVGEQANNGRKRPLKTPVLHNSQRTISSVSIDLVMPSGSKKKVQTKVRTLNQGSKRIAAASNETTSSPKAWRPPLAEIKENVAEILRQRPDPRADDPRFVRFLADQLFDAQRGKLNPSRVHRDLQDRHDLDDWTTDLLFTIATIDLNITGVMN